MARRYFLRLCEQMHGNVLSLENVSKLFPVYLFAFEFCKQPSCKKLFLFLRDTLSLLKVVRDVSWSPSFIVWFLNFA